ncbi:unnamed protein product, partial [Scytosiphon promiscuus]
AADVSGPDVSRGGGPQGGTPMGAGNSFFLPGDYRPAHPPKFDARNPRVWMQRFLNHMEGRGLGHLFAPSINIIPVMNDENRSSLVFQYGQDNVRANQRAWDLLQDSTAGAVFEERMLSSKTVLEAWGVIVSWYSPSSRAEVALMERELDMVRNYVGEDPKLFFVRVDKLKNALHHAGITKTEVEIVDIILRNLSSDYDVEKKSRLAEFNLSRDQVERIVRKAYANRKVEELRNQLAPSSAKAAVQPDPHALLISGGHRRDGGGTGGFRRGGGGGGGGGGRGGGGGGYQAG